MCNSNSDYKERSHFEVSLILSIMIFLLDRKRDLKIEQRYRIFI